MKSMLLHTCCAICLSEALWQIKDSYDISLFFYNPNLVDEEEYFKRLFALKQYVDILENEHNITFKSFIIMPYDKEEHNTAIAEHKNLGEKSQKCFCCYKLRLKKTFDYAKDLSLETFATTLQISRHKNTAWLSEIGEKLSVQPKRGKSPKFIPLDPKKNKQTYSNIIKDNNLYRQSFCGCIR